MRRSEERRRLVVTGAEDNPKVGQTSMASPPTGQSLNISEALSQISSMLSFRVLSGGEGGRGDWSHDCQCRIT